MSAHTHSPAHTHTHTHTHTQNHTPELIASTCQGAISEPFMVDEQVLFSVLGLCDYSIIIFHVANKSRVNPTWQ